MPLSYPDGTDHLVAAAQWIEQALLGTAATIVATLAVAAIGGLMLSGRVPVRRGLGVVGGCFLLFGATTIARGIVQLVDQGTDNRQVSVAMPPPPAPPPALSPPQPQVYDPYAGASVPVR